MYYDQFGNPIRPSAPPYQQQLNYSQPMQQMPQQQVATAPVLQGVQFATFDEVKNFIIPPSTGRMFMDSNEQRFYVKTADGIGRPVIETFEFRKLEEPKPKPPEAPAPVQTAPIAVVPLDQYVKKDELKATNDQIQDLMKEIEKLKGGQSNGESVIQL